MTLKMYEEISFRVKNVIGIAAGKGGVGKSTVTVHLAVALHEMGFRVGILDTDIYGPSIRKMLPEGRLPRKRGDVIIPAWCSGIQMLSVSYFREENKAAAVRAPIANGIVTQFLQGVDWGELDYLLIDFPPGTGDIQLTLAQRAHLSGALLVTTPQEVALLDVRKAAHLFEQVRIPVLGIVENMSYFQEREGGEKKYLFGKGGGRRFASEIGVPLLGEIPVHPGISSCGDRGLLPAMQEGLECIVGYFNEIASQMQEQLEALKEGKQAPLFPMRIETPTPSTLKIIWSDGREKNYPSHLLQNSCPCATCAEGSSISREDVIITNIEKIGRYALRFTFSSGCMQGIYDFDYLQQMNL